MALGRTEGRLEAEEEAATWRRRDRCGSRNSPGRRWPRTSRSDDIALFPVGSTEQHGPAGPLGVDSYAAIALAEDAARATGVLVTPPLWFGDSPHHLDFPGTLSLQHRDAGGRGQGRGPQPGPPRLPQGAGDQRAQGHQPRRAHHRAAVAPPERAARTCSWPSPTPCTWPEASPTSRTRPEHHAGELEISHVWYKHPELIRTDRLTHEQVDLGPCSRASATRICWAAGATASRSSGTASSKGVRAHRLVLHLGRGVAGEGPRVPRVHGARTWWSSSSGCAPTEGPIGGAG